MTRRHYIAIAKVIRDTKTLIPGDERLELANEFADMLGQPGMAKNFDREMFVAYATSATPED